MADSEVSVRVRIRGAREAAVEAEVVAEAVDNIGDKARRAKTELRELNAEQLASKGIALLASQGRDTASQLGSVAGGIRGVWLAAAAASPGLLALGGALLSIAGSAGAAMLGAGAVGGGGIAALAVGLGGVGIIAKSAAGEFSKTSKALDAYHLAVAQYGHGSTQAVAAQARLNALVKEQGGPTMLAAVQNWKALGRAWKDATGPARGAVGGIFSDGLSAMHGLLPTFASQTNRNATALRGSLGQFFGAFSGAEGRGAISDFSGAFRGMLPGLTGGGIGALTAIERVLRAALPYAVGFANAFGAFGAHLAHLSADGSRVQTFVGGIVGQLKSWLNLGHALGAVMFDLLAGGAKEGQGLVDSLSRVVWHFDKWLDSAKGQSAMRTFFSETAKDARLIGSGLLTFGLAVGNLMHGGMPGFTAALQGAQAYLALMAPRLQLVADVLRFLGPLAKPVTEFFLIWKTAGMFVAGIDSTVTALRGLRGALFGVAEAEAVSAGAGTASKFGEQLALDLPGTVAGKGGLFKRMGSRIGGMLGMAGWVGFAAVFIANLPSLMAMLPLGNDWQHEAQRGLLPNLPSTMLLFPEGAGGHKRSDGTYTDTIPAAMQGGRGGNFNPVSSLLPRASKALGIDVKGKLAHVARSGGGDVTVRVPVYLDRKKIAEALAQDTKDRTNRR